MIIILEVAFVDNFLEICQEAKIVASEAQHVWSWRIMRSSKIHCRTLRAGLVIYGQVFLTMSLNFHLQVTLNLQLHSCTSWILVVEHIQRFYLVLKQSGSSKHLERSTPIWGIERWNCDQLFHTNARSWSKTNFVVLVARCD